MKGASGHRGDPRGCRGQTGPVLRQLGTSRDLGVGTEPQPLQRAQPCPPHRPQGVRVQFWCVESGLWGFAAKSQDVTAQNLLGHTGMCGAVSVTQTCPTLCNRVTVARQAALSVGFSRQECWSGLPYPPPGDLPDLGIEPRSPALQADSLPTKLPGKLLRLQYKAG